MSAPSAEAPRTRTQPRATLGTPQDVEDCLPCRIVGSGALGTVGLYALNQSRAHQPGSVIGKRIMAGVGVCFLVASALRWTK